MALYPFAPLDLPPAPPATAGTEFQDIANSTLFDPDAIDAGLTAAELEAWNQVVAGFADLDGLGQDIADAVAELNVLQAEADADTLLDEIAAAAEQDAGLASLGQDVVGGIAALDPNLWADLVNSLVPWLTANVNYLIQLGLSDEVPVIESYIEEWIGSGLGGGLPPSPIFPSPGPLPDPGDGWGFP
jgi:hypothetical protein